MAVHTEQNQGPRRNIFLGGRNFVKKGMWDNRREAPADERNKF